MLRESYNQWKVADDTTFITTLGGTQYLYLLEGSERALLIDTAYGCGRLREYVERLTDKPIMVANTHGHLDHVGGNGWWEEVHIHADAAADMANTPPLPERRTLPWPRYRKVFVGEGFVFDLGGREVEVMEISAHAPGSIAFIDRGRSMLFSGDELEGHQVLLFDHVPGTPGLLRTRVEKHLANMSRLRARQAEFSYVCPAHNGSPIACSYIEDFIELDKAILEGRQRVSSRVGHWYLSRLPFAHELRRATYGKASIIYRTADE